MVIVPKMCRTLLAEESLNKIESKTINLAIFLLQSLSTGLLFEEQRLQKLLDKRERQKQVRHINNI
jgi:hypothetical protein